MSISSEESEEIASCGDCNTPLDETRDGHEDDGGRCHNCYWEEENARARREKDIVELEPEYRPSDWLKKNRPHIWEKLKKKGTKRKSEDMSGGMTPEQQTMYTNQLKRLGEIIVKRIEDEIQKAKFLDVFPTMGDMERLTNLEIRTKSLSEVLNQRNQPFGLEMVIIDLREIENELNQERFEKERSDEGRTDTPGTFYEIELANFLVDVNKRFPEETMPHLNVWETKQLPDAAGPVGGKRKTRKSTNKKKNKKTRSKKQKGGDIDAKLYTAASQGNVDAVVNMLNDGADINKNSNLFSYTPLYVASRNGHVEVVNVLLERGADIDKATDSGETPLMVVSWMGHLEVVRVLLEQGADINKARHGGATPLYMASQNGQVDVVRVLLEQGAEIDKARNDGATPLYMASHNGHVEVVRVLVERGADINKATDSGYKPGHTPLIEASQQGQVDVVRVLVEQGADIDKAEENGITPLMIAADSGHLKVVEALIEYGANVNAKTNEGDTAFDLASQWPSPTQSEIQNILKQNMLEKIIERTVERQELVKEMDRRGIHDIPAEIGMNYLGGKRKTRKSKKSKKRKTHKKK